MFLFLNYIRVDLFYHVLSTWAEWRATFIRKSKLFWWLWLVQSVFERVDVIGQLTVWYRGILLNFHMWTGVKNFRPESGMKLFIHEIGVNFLSGMFNLVPHVKFLICIHFKHVSGVNQVWNRSDLMRIFCTGSILIITELYKVIPFLSLLSPVSARINRFEWRSDLLIMPLRSSRKDSKLNFEKCVKAYLSSYKPPPFLF